MRLGIDAANIRVGGGITHLSNLLRALDPVSQGIDHVTVWSGSATLRQLPQGLSHVSLVHMPELDGAIGTRLLWQIRRLHELASARCDLLFVPGGLYLGRFRPVVTMSQNMLPYSPREMARYGPSLMWARLVALRLLQSRSFKASDGVIFLTDHARSTILSAIGPIRGMTAVIPHGVDPGPRDGTPESAELHKRRAGRTFSLIYVSIIDVYKHQWNVAEAVASLRAAGLPVSLELVGPAYGPSLRRLRSTLARLDPGGEFIRYRGAVPYRDVRRMYAEADAFVFASSCENLPNTLLEAMAARLPIACSDVEPMLSILGSAGSYFDPDDPAQIAASIRKLYEDPEMLRRHSIAAASISTAYTWDLCARRTIEFFRGVYEASGGRHAG